MKRLLFLLFFAISSIASATCYFANLPTRYFVGGLWGERSFNFGRTVTSTLVIEDNHYSHDIWGAVAGFEHIEPCSLYYRLKWTYETGKRRNAIRQNVWDHQWWVETHIGYSFPLDSYSCLLFTPFIGYGYFQDNLHNYTIGGEKEIFQYVPVGLMFSYSCLGCWNVAWRAQVNLMFQRSFNDGRSEPIQRRTFYYSDFPITYHFCRYWDISVVPFYQWAPNVTYRTIDNTQLKWGQFTTWGTRLELGLDF